MKEQLGGGAKIETLEDKLNLLKRDLANLVGGSHEDYIIDFSEDAVRFVSDRAFMDTIQRDSRNILFHLENQKHLYKNVRIEEGLIVADLVSPIEKITKIKVKIEKARV